MKNKLNKKKGFGIGDWAQSQSPLISKLVFAFHIKIKIYFINYFYKIIINGRPS